MDQADQDDAIYCAICGTTEGDSAHLSSQTTLQTNATVRCGHQFCTNCVDRELVRKREFPCPTCKTPVKRVTLTIRTLDDVQCEKDTSWRRRVLQVFNKAEQDFDTLLEYNNYLENVEDMIYSIVNEEPDAEECKAKVKEYEQLHRAEIVMRQSQRADHERSIQDRIAAEQRQTERQRAEALEDMQHMVVTKAKLKQEATQVLLGERQTVSAELVQAQMQGYRNEIRRQARGKNVTNFVSPRVREPPAGWQSEPPLDRQLYLKRQAAGGGIPTGSITAHERSWNETVYSLFAISQNNVQ